MTTDQLVAGLGVGHRVAIGAVILDPVPFYTLWYWSIAAFVTGAISSRIAYPQLNVSVHDDDPCICLKCTNLLGRLTLNATYSHSFLIG